MCSFFFSLLSYDFFFVCAFALEPFALGLLALLDKFQILHARTQHNQKIRRML